jgi:hypothetical protein
MTISSRDGALGRQPAQIIAAPMTGSVMGN